MIAFPGERLPKLSGVRTFVKAIRRIYTFLLIHINVNTDIL